MEDAGVDQGQVRRRATFCPPSLACLPAHPAGAGDRNLSFVLAPPSVPSNLNVYGEGLVRLGILQSSASVWNGEFSEAQWAALLAWGKVPPPPPLLQPLVHMASPPLLPAPASCSSRRPRARQGLMAPAPPLAAPAAPIGSAEQAAAAAAAAAPTAASGTATSAAPFAISQSAAAAWSPPPPLSEQMAHLQQLAMAQQVQQQMQQSMPAPQLATPQQGVPGRKVSVEVSHGSLPSACLSTVQPAPTAVESAGRTLEAGLLQIQQMWKDEPARRVLEQQALVDIVAKLDDVSCVQGVARVLEAARNLQALQVTHYNQAAAQAEPVGALLNQAMEALEETSDAMSGAERLDFGLRTATEPPPPASQVPLPSWVSGPLYNTKDPLLVRRSPCLLRADRAHPHHTPPRFLPRPSQPRTFARPALLLSWQPCRLQATEAVLLVPGGSASKLTSALNPRRTAVTVTIRNAERTELVRSDGRAQGKRSETVELIRPVAGDAVDGDPTLADTGFGLLTVTYVLDPPQGSGAAPEEADPSSSVEGPPRTKRYRDESASS